MAEPKCAELRENKRGHIGPGREPVNGRPLPEVTAARIDVRRLVGPIFLIVYYAFETPYDRQSSWWMSVARLILTVADLLVALALAGQSTRRTAKTAVLEQNRVLTLARVTDMTPDAGKRRWIIAEI